MSIELDGRSVDFKIRPPQIVVAEPPYVSSEVIPKLPIVDVFVEQAISPPGKQVVIGSFNRVTAQLAQSDAEVHSLLKEFSESGMPDAYIVNRLYRGVQSAIILTDEPNFPSSYDRDENWYTYWDKIKQNPELKALIIHEMKSAPTATTVWQRYGGLALLGSLVRGPIEVVDVGCAGDYIRGLELGEPFQPIRDATPDRGIASLIESYHERFDLRRYVSIDKYNSRDGEGKEARLRGMYPSELAHVPAIRAFEERIAQASRGVFWERDLTKEPLTDADAFFQGRHRFAFYSTICYQLSPSEMDAMFAQTDKLLNVYGHTAIQDFADIDEADPTKLNFRSDWGTPYAYGLFLRSRDGKYREVVRWENGRCGSVLPGKDLEEVKNMLTQ